MTTGLLGKIGMFKDLLAFKKASRKLVPVEEILFAELDKSAALPVTEDEVAQIAKQFGLTNEDVRALYHPERNSPKSKAPKQGEV